MNLFFKNLFGDLFNNNNYIYLIDGLKTSLKVTFFALLLGFTLGLFIAIVKSSHKDIQPEWSNPSGFLFNLLNLICSVFVTVIRGTPSTLQLLVMFNVILKNLDNLVIVAILSFGFNVAAYIAEIFRGGIQSVDPGEIESARSLGLTYLQTSQYLIIPQAFKYSLPAMGNEIITLFKETSISGFIGLVDITRGANIIISKTFNAVPPYLASALIYLSIVLLLERLFEKLEEKSDYVKH